MLQSVLQRMLQSVAECIAVVDIVSTLHVCKKGNPELYVVHT